MPKDNEIRDLFKHLNQRTPIAFVEQGTSFIKGGARPDYSPRGPPFHTGTHTERLGPAPLPDWTGPICAARVGWQ